MERRTSREIPKAARSAHFRAFLSCRSALCGLSLLLSATITRAQDPASNEPPIATDRPAVADSSLVVPKGRLILESGVADTRSQGRSILDVPEALLRFGMTSKTELRLAAPDDFQEAGGPPGAVGWGDMSVGLKQQLVASPSLDAALVVALSLPTGASAVSSHGYDPQLLLPWSHPLSGTWTAAGMFSFFWPTEGSSRNPTGQGTALVDRQVTSRWDVFLEYAGEWPERGGAQHILHLGMALKTSSSRQWDLHGGVGLSPAAPSYFVGIGFSLQARILPGRKGASP